MNILITGATGMAGSEVVRQAITDPSVQQIVLLTRKKSPFDHPKIKEVIHTDFMRYTGLEDVFRSVNACIWCLGISQSRVSKDEYFAITHDYVVAAAKAMLGANPEMTFLFLSGEGADSSEKSRVRFAKVKGQAENALIRLNLHKLFIFRPGGILPTNRNSNEGAYKKFEILMVRIMNAVAPWSVVSTRQLALAMLRVARQGWDQTILGHKTIKSF